MRIKGEETQSSPILCVCAKKYNILERVDFLTVAVFFLSHTNPKNIEREHNFSTISSSF